MKNDSSKSAKRNSGFALIMTIALLTLLVLLLLGLAALMRVETANSADTQKQVQARQNALLALDLALGQLQKYAGPDQRVTATAQALAENHRRYTGVWDATNHDSAPLTWLVSGNEGTDGLAVTPATVGANVVELAGTQTTGVRDEIVAPKQPIQVSSFRGQPGLLTVGNYAWWVGDQGVKAPVATEDRSAALTYAPYDVAELRGRVRQQSALDAKAAEFEPRDSSNLPYLRSILAFNQLAFLKRPDAAAVGLTTLKQNFHLWSPGNFAVLANSKTGGLRQDLSLQPGLLGEAFAAWTHYATYMEDPASVAKSPLPNPNIVNAESMRRRYRLRPPTIDRGIAAGPAPVLALCLLNFDDRTLNGATGTAPIESRLRWIIGLWNPYSSALVPEDLRLEISGLPTAVEFTPSFTGPTLASFSLAELFGAPLRLALPWDQTRADLQGQPDVSSWLPGRIYYWTSLANTSEPPGGNAGYFYSKSLIGSPSRVVSRVSSATVSGNAVGGWRVNNVTTLTVRLYRAGNTTPLATYTSPAFPPFFATDAVATPRASSGSYEFSFFFRLDQNRVAGESVWLITAQRDPRSTVLPAEAFVGGNQGPQPSAYPGVPAITNDDLLLERAMADYGQSYNEDVPVFELPRAPLLSVGALQHLLLVGERPFTVGNSWGQAGGWNALFDRFFFSGLTNEVALPDVGAGQPLPNTLLTVLPRRPDGSAVTALDLRAEAADGHAAFSSRYLLGRGAFNLNSVQPEAWMAVLGGTRYGANDRFTFLNATETTGTGGDAPGLPMTGPMSATFFRLAQSAGETFKAQPGKAGGLSGGFNHTPSVVANTHLFRCGLRVLTTTEVSVAVGLGLLAVGSVSCNAATRRSMVSGSGMTVVATCGGGGLWQAVRRAQSSIAAEVRRRGGVGLGSGLRAGETARVGFVLIILILILLSGSTSARKYTPPPPRCSPAAGPCLLHCARPRPRRRRTPRASAR